MMTMELIREDRDGMFDAFVLHHPKGHILQTFAWARVKTCWQPWGVLVRRGGKIVGTLLVLQRRLPFARTSILYAPRGPVCMLTDAETLRLLLEGAREIAQKTGAYVLRMDPDVPSEDVSFQMLMQKYGAFLLPDAGELEHIQSQHVMRIDLTDRDEEAVFASFKPKTRYNIRLAMRRGVTVRVVDETYLDAFTELMRQTGRRDGFAVRDRAYFASILKNLGQQVRLFMAFDDAGVPLSGAIAAYGGGKMLYLYGASGNYRRECMPNYLMQWEMIRWATACRCAVYDLRGVPADPQNSRIEGLYRFKSGFGGKRVDFVGEYHVVYRPHVYQAAERLLPAAQSVLRFINRARNAHGTRFEPQSGETESTPASGQTDAASVRHSLAGR